MAPSGAAPSTTEAEKTAKIAMRVALAAGALGARFVAFNSQIAKNPAGFAVGDSLTVADLALYCKMQSFTAGLYVRLQSSFSLRR